MAAGTVTIYINGSQSVEVQKKDVTLGDLVSIECVDPVVAAKLKSLKMIRISEEKSQRYVVSILKLIEKMHEVYPNLQAENLGPADLIVTYEPAARKRGAAAWCKTAAVALVSFFGAAFSIMTFNNDVNTPKLFRQIYEQIMGVQKTGFTVMELAYSIGISVGILVFFNPFCRKKATADPTPMEVEMRTYEQEIQSALIENYARKERELDVGKGSVSGGGRP